MIRALITCVFLLFTTFVYGFDVDDLFGDGENDFELTRFTNRDILLQIAADAKVACNGTLCTIFSKDDESRDFEVSFDIGEGNSSGSSFGFPSSGSSSSSSGDLSWSIELKYTVSRCVQKINVDRTLFFVIKRYFYGLVNGDGEPNTVLTPADTAVINFMTAIVAQATGCKS